MTTTERNSRGSVGSDYHGPLSEFNPILEPTLLTVGWSLQRRILARRFVTKVDCSPGYGPQGDCYRWIGATNGHYGHLSAPGNPGKPLRMLYAHRAAYALVHGPIPAGLYVLHRCDTPLCVRPAHLWLGTQRDNMLDARAKHPWKRANRQRRLPPFWHRVSNDSEESWERESSTAAWSI